MRRGLHNRHIQLIALGGAIGTGLFYGAADSIGAAGPAVALCYLVGGAIIYLIMRALGEMSTHRPTSGAFSEYAHDYWGELPGFVSGWNYWFNYVAVSMAELSVVGIYVNYWFPSVPSWVSAAVLLVAVTAINLLHVRAYGEFEFWFAIVKVVAIVAMVLLGLWIIVFGAGGHAATGISNLWNDGGFAPHGLAGLAIGFVVVMFSFGGVELVGITAGEATDPRRTIPRAINQVVHRILLFYVCAVLVIVAIVPWRTIDGNSSPFVQIFDRVGVPGAATILNIVVLTAAVSAYNSGLYSNGRMLHSLAHQGNAPAILGRVSRHGAPWVAILVSSAMTLIAVVLVAVLPKQAFGYIMSIALVAGIINWSMIVITQMKFRRRADAATLASLTFRMPGAPVTNWIVLAALAATVVIMATSPTYRIAVIIGPIWVALLIAAHTLAKRAGHRRAHTGQS
ncbi:amino acid permease [Acidipropionibacterium timonense]|uniref:amino acid permease n=1 Tax=Acidipropionibacterium timonense TaxID=2161818 RepID=UPI00102F6CE9|nr:amino acid permease [Acidipropionibacterium timonense]